MLDADHRTIQFRTPQAPSENNSGNIWSPAPLISGGSNNRSDSDTATIQFPQRRGAKQASSGH